MAYDAFYFVFSFAGVLSLVKNNCLAYQNEEFVLVYHMQLPK